MMDKKEISRINDFKLPGSSIKWSQYRGKHTLFRTTLVTLSVLVSLALSSCSATNNTTNPPVTQPPAGLPQATTVPTQASAPATGIASQNPATPTTASIPANTSTPLPNAVATALDPCVLIDSQAASKLAGVTFGDGVESTTPEGLKMCTYGSQSTNILIVDVVQAPDLATAQAAKQQFLTDLQTNLQQLTSQGMNITQLPDFADGAVMANVNVDAGGISISGNAMGFLKGTVFFGFSDVVLGGTAPNDKAMQDEATAVLAMLP